MKNRTKPPKHVKRCWAWLKAQKRKGLIQARIYVEEDAARFKSVIEKIINSRSYNKRKIPKHCSPNRLCKELLKFQNSPDVKDHYFF